MSGNGKGGNKQFEEEDDIGFRFTRSSKRHGNGQRRRSTIRRSINPAELVREEDEDTTQRDYHSSAPLPIDAEPVPPSDAARSRPSSDEDVALCLEQIAQQRVVLEETRAEVDTWHSVAGSHQATAEDVRQQLTTARAECCMPLAHHTLLAKLSEERRRRLEALPDARQSTQELKEMGQQLVVLTDKVEHWRRLCTDLSEHADIVARQQRKRVAEASHRDTVSGTPLKLAKLTHGSATPAVRVSRRTRGQPPAHACDT